MSRADLLDSLMLEKKIKKYGVKIVRLDCPNLDDDSFVGKVYKSFKYLASADEREKICTRFNNGKRNKLDKGYRPFIIPVGYIRNRVSSKEYIDEIDPLKGPILKEGLELFAHDVIETQADLWRFRDAKKLTTSRFKTTYLPKTFPEKVLQIHRLIFYAGYIIYPER